MFLTIVTCALLNVHQTLEETSKLLEKSVDVQLPLPALIPTFACVHSGFIGQGGPGNLNLTNTPARFSTADL